MPRILCVEDEAAIRAEVVEELQDAGYETLEACNGQEGLEAIQKHKPDLVISDITMPIMDGHELVKALREKHPEMAELPFIFLSALADRDHILDGKKLGADDYLTKPIDFEMLLATVESRMRQVTRMVARKDEQLIKLYKSVAPDSSASATDNAAPCAKVPAQAPPVEAPNAGSRVESNAVSSEGAAEDFGDKLTGVVAANEGVVVSGLLQLVGLKEVREQLGDRWDKYSQQVYNTAESVIRMRLSPEDVFRRNENDDFVICFASLNEQAGAFKAQSIGREIREKLIGGFGEQNPLSGGTAGKSDGGHDFFAVVTETHSLAIEPTEADESDDLLSLVTARLSQASERIKASAKVTMTEIFRSCQLDNRQVQTRTGSIAPLAIGRFDKQTQARVDKLLLIGGDQTNIACQIDLLALSQVAEHICEGLLHNKSSMIVADVDFSTLDSKRHLDRYISLCHKLLDKARETLILRVKGIRAEVFPGRVTEVINRVRPFCRLLMVQIDKPQLENIDLGRSQIALVAIDHSGLAQALKNEGKQVQKLVQQLHSSKARLLVDNVPGKNAQRQLAELGVDFMSFQDEAL